MKPSDTEPGFTSVGIDGDFASPAEWARLYRRRNLQVVPAFMPGEAIQWKRPLLQSWTEFQEELVPDEVFLSWYGPGGQYVTRSNMGAITGRASDNLLVIDLDDYKNLGSKEWWNDLIERENNRIDPETCEQRTGGGGRQKIFRAPPGWAAPNKTIHSMGIDIKGQGGFVMLPPSMHESGKAYEWSEGQSPDDIPIEMAPDWLLEAVEDLIEQHGGVAGSTGVRHQQGPQARYNNFGKQIDGRETKMRDMVWRCVVKWHRQCPIQPNNAESARKAREEYEVYARQVGPRHDVPDEGITIEQQMEREGRGWPVWWSKWQRAFRKWEGRVREDAKKPDPHPEDVSRETDYRDYSDEYKVEPKIDPATGQPFPLVLTSAEFVKAYRPPDYLIDGVIQQSYIYSLTARTHHGKTAVMLLMASRIARGLEFHGRPTKQGSVLIFAGENPDDVRARWLVLAQHEGFDVNTIPVYFVDGVVSIRANLVLLREAAERIANLTLVVVDTAAAYFPGDEGNSNAQQGAYARLLRELTQLSGKPAGVINCHPVKNAAEDNLLPMGGSAFVNEIDGNLTLWAESEEKQTSLHWQGKFRGPEFEAMPFELRTATADTVKDSQGRCMPSVVAVPITEDGAERRSAVAEEDEKTILRLLHADKNASFSTLAKRAGFMLADGETPSKSKVQRIVRRLLASKFVSKYSSGKYRLTRKGCKHVNLKWEGKEEDE